MIKKNPLPSVERLNEFFKYDTCTGTLSWRVDRNRVKAGMCINRKVAKGYIAVNADGLPFLAHRIIWKMMTGKDPSNDIDHIDGNHSNNRFANLREATDVQNMANRKRPIVNTSGVKGVCFHRGIGKWHAKVTANHHCHHIGYFNDLKEAEVAVNAARARLHGEFARTA